ncbi:hypothetical protein [Tritonibacter multivorans]|uniref:hypothetical protein n=1 Tax=Tritonibacter multivorans TaxID=928856 RepID=UPI00071D800D|nr:hypothetical protein [Tritonibacter multivorans]
MHPKIILGFGSDAGFIQFRMEENQIIARPAYPSSDSLIPPLVQLGQNPLKRPIYSRVSHRPKWRPRSQMDRNSNAARQGFLKNLQLQMYQQLSAAVHTSRFAGRTSE